MVNAEPEIKFAGNPLQPQVIGKEGPYFLQLDSLGSRAHLNDGSAKCHMPHNGLESVHKQ